MSAILLTWKPSEWDYEALRDRLKKFEQGESRQRWSCGSTKNVPIGTRAFLTKQGKGEKGIFGAGVVVRSPYFDDHYSEEKRLQGKKALYLEVEFEYLADPMSSGIAISREELQVLDEKVWDSQGSGKSIPKNIEQLLEALWLERVHAKTPLLPEEVDVGESLFEGAKRSIVVNAYERDATARSKCIAHWGLSCAVCGFHFEYFYGEIGARYIHVHHLKPLAEIRAEYQVDPVNDLRPVCPNCHAMLHKRKPPYSIEELSEVVSTYGRPRT